MSFLRIGFEALTVMTPEPVHFMRRRYQWLYLLRGPAGNTVALWLSTSMFLPFILNLTIATVIIEVLVAPIRVCTTATGRRMGFVSD